MTHLFLVSCQFLKMSNAAIKDVYHSYSLLFFVKLTSTLTIDSQTVLICVRVCMQDSRILLFSFCEYIDACSAILFPQTPFFPMTCISLLTSSAYQLGSKCIMSSGSAFVFMHRLTFPINVTHQCVNFSALVR